MSPIIKDINRVVAVCNSCDRQSDPVDVIAPYLIGGSQMDEAFAKIMWLVTWEGAWCPDCKGLPR